MGTYRVKYKDSDYVNHKDSIEGVVGISVEANFVVLVDGIQQILALYPAHSIESIKLEGLTDDEPGTDHA